MKTRMEKYYDEENNNIALRERKNKNLYENINDYEVEDYEIKTNATVLDNNAKNIDVEKIKKILDTKYNKQPKRRSIVVDEEDYQEPDISLDETREYDINAILEKARSEKEVDYEKERLKKIRDTQYDILNSLDIDTEKKEEPTEEKNELMDLINTITAKELEVKNQKEDLDEEADKIKPTIMENKTQDLTSTLQFTQSDFDDFNDLKKEVKSSRALIYIIIVIVCLILIAGVIIFLNKFLNLSLF